MSHKFLEPIKIGNQTVKNRVMFLAMAKNISNFDDSVSAKDIAYVESVAAGGVGLLVPGAMIVDPEWPSVLPLQPGIYDDRFIPGLRRLVLAAHKYDAKILFQLWHPGATNYSGIDPKTVDELTKDEIHAIQDKFGRCQACYGRRCGRHRVPNLSWLSGLPVHFSSVQSPH